MQELRTAWTVALCAGFIGATLGTLARKLPQRGILAVVLVIIAAGFVPFIDRPDASAAPAYLPLVAFMLLAPFSALYSIWSFRKASDRGMAIGAFIGGIIVGALFLLELAGAAFIVFGSFSYKI